MASKKKPYRPKTKVHSRSDAFRAFISDLLSGAIRATKMFVTGSQNRPNIEYDDPNG